MKCNMLFRVKINHFNRQTITHFSYSDTIEHNINLKIFLYLAVSLKIALFIVNRSSSNEQIIAREEECYFRK